MHNSYGHGKGDVYTDDKKTANTSWSEHTKSPTEEPVITLESHRRHCSQERSRRRICPQYAEVLIAAEQKTAGKSSSSVGTKSRKRKPTDGATDDADVEPRVAKHRRTDETEKIVVGKSDNSRTTRSKKRKLPTDEDTVASNSRPRRQAKRISRGTTAVGSRDERLKTLRPRVDGEVAVVRGLKTRGGEAAKKARVFGNSVLVSRGCLLPELEIFHTFTMMRSIYLGIPHPPCTGTDAAAIKLIKDQVGPTKGTLVRIKREEAELAEETGLAMTRREDEIEANTRSTISEHLTWAYPEGQGLDHGYLPCDIRKDTLTTGHLRLN
ncbi:hypothetical protein BGZ57DRAFT_861702 [Hyaloscypha finlandica]|nr:hypothetical protein BGZ57DRAFT_861702 [Hyaloscypha finlandica]